jgi:N-acetylglucosamine-6-phosphate deacetylase
VTHFYDTFDVPEQVDPGVYPVGLTDYLLIDDRVSLEAIPDGVHVHPILLEKVVRCKGIDQVIMITDSVKGAGNVPGVYDGLYKGVKIQVTENRGMRRTSDDTLSGSALTQVGAFRNMVTRFGRSIREASIMGSRNPARVLGLPHKGHLAVGMDADIMILDSDLQVQHTIVGGSLLYSA